MYAPPTRRRAKCSCLLCADSNNVDMKGSHTKDFANEESHASEGDANGSASVNGKTSSESSSDKSTSSEINEELPRAVHLYCRLNYRKGPWFRLDDIYTRYYAPKKPSTAPEDEHEAIEATGSEDSVICERRNSFFSAKNGMSKQSQAIKKEGAIDHSLLQDHFSALTVMLRDIERLHAIGLIRSFDSEEECGKTAGAVTAEGSGVLLLAEERRAVVGKLGGSNKKAGKQRQNDIDTIPGKRRSISPRENMIWKQMRQQTSISLGVTKEGKSYLPVCRHVDDILLDKLATCMVLASSRVEYVPAAILRPAVSELKTRILGQIKSTPQSVTMCLTLREAPLLTLRRCARLYLCATSGPGDMRGDGTNAWRSLASFDAASIHPDIPLPHVIQPPGSHSWHRVVYPPLSHRFGLTMYAFLHAHEFLECDDSSSEMEEQDARTTCSDTITSRGYLDQIFHSVGSFQLWESCVELRAHIDYHIELNDTIQYQARRRARESSASENVEPLNPTAAKGAKKRVHDDVEARAHGALTQENPLDFLKLLTVDGRRLMIYKLTAFCDFDDEDDERGRVNGVYEEVERVIAELETFIDDESKRALNDDESEVAEFFNTDSERVVVAISVVISQILAVRHQSITTQEVLSMKSRPWLRHLYWEAILAYALWDCIPLLERKGFYELASSCLEVILFGKIQLREKRGSLAMADNLDFPGFDTLPLPELLVSRRTRGKAHERLMIDYVHLLRWRSKNDSTLVPSDNNVAQGVKSKGSRKKGGSSGEAEVSPQDVVRQMCNRVVGVVASAGSIPFSAVRSLARRLKAPLAESLEARRCAEAMALGLRLDNSTDTTTDDPQEPKGKGYIDWLPPTDYAVANAIASEESIVGKRCSFVGFEDDDNEKVDTSSLNVEQLAMQYYATGRLPSADKGNESLCGGGWKGYHDEGGHVRALFRVVCSRSLLGMDSGCGSIATSQLESIERLTIHLTPYQGAPFDLHVAHWGSPVEAATDEEKIDREGAVRSFYERRRRQIDAFLSKLEEQNDQSLCDLVYDSIVARLELLGEGRVQTELLARDIQQIRTLSMLAAGFGGRQLSAMFRCLLFDYRHYSGGLPDLLLVRASFKNDNNSLNEEKPKLDLVDLGEWVGEQFSEASKIAQEAMSGSNILIDKDDEFLGCSKVGDSGAQSTSRWRRGAPRRQTSRNDSTNNSDDWCIDKLPPRLVLRHDDRDVRVQCMFVEVKSLTDRLDGRQEDWLNVLDRVGNARVCKFGDGKKTRKAPK